MSLIAPQTLIQHVDARQPRWPLHDAAASRALEAEAARSRTPHALMAAAGLSVARLAMALWPHARRVRIWAGTGNNGGDGLVAAQHLHAAGLQVAVSLLGDARRLPDDALWALTAAQAAGVCVTDNFPASAEADDLHIDALLGLGASRAPVGSIAQSILAMNAAARERGLPVLAVDLPSGLSADTGTVLGSVAVQASATLSLLTLKPGCYTNQGRDHSGEVWFDDLGVAPSEPTAWLCHATPIPVRAHVSHKGRFGDVVVVGGADGMAGAAWLAARAALAAGAGRVITSLLGEGAALYDPLRPELMGRTAYWTSDPATLAATTVVCGCGGGLAVRDALPALLSHATRLVLDADALNAIAADVKLQQATTQRAARGQATVLTPHPLEAARLLGSTSAEVQGDRLNAARKLAARFGATVVLKGSGSVIAALGERPCLCATGNAALSTAGTGDVLAGWLGGLWAQQPATAPMAVATQAVTLHGDAADNWLAAGHRGPMRANDLVEHLALR